jgi:hypothetical protein
VAEDARLCKKGHQRIPGDTQCRVCHRENQARYRAAGKHKAAQARYEKTPKGRANSARYRATTKRWVVYRRYELKGQREAIQAKLESLKRQEEECLTFLTGQIQTK